MKKNFVVYAIDTGKILNRLSIPALFADAYQPTPGTQMIEVEDDQPYEMTHRVVGGLIVPKQTFSVSVSDMTILANGTTVSTLSSVPAGTKVSITGPVSAEGIVNDGQIEVTASVAGDYTVRLSRMHYLDWEVTIHAI
jgi:hypothetical protein